MFIILITFCGRMMYMLIQIFFMAEISMRILNFGSYLALLATL